MVPCWATESVGEDARRSAVRLSSPASRSPWSGPWAPSSCWAALSTGDDPTSDLLGLMAMIPAGVPAAAYGAASG
jgi:hypothetical protein